MWRSLVWKEWHEQRWKLAFGCVLLMGFTAVGLHSRMTEDSTILALAGYFGVLILPLFTSMSLVAAERSENSINTLLSLPARTSVIFSAKMVIGILVTAVPLIGSAVISLLMAGEREYLTSQIIQYYTLMLMAAAFAFVWVAVFSLRQPTEARAGLAGIAVIGVWFMVISGYQMFHFWYGAGAWSHSLTPLGLTFLARLNEHSVMYVLFQGVITALLWLWGIHRLAKPTKGAMS